jgi:hypothetical protein
MVAKNAHSRESTNRAYFRLEDFQEDQKENLL